MNFRWADSLKVDGKHFNHPFVQVPIFNIENGEEISHSHFKVCHFCGFAYSRVHK